MDCSTPGFLVPHLLPEFAQVHVPCISDAIQPFHPLIPSSLSALNLSQHQGLFQWVLFSSVDQNTGASALASVLPVNIQGWSSLRLTGLISLQSKETFKSLLQLHSLKASILWCSAFFLVQFSQPYVTTGKTITLTILTFAGRVMSLLFNTLSRFVITLLPRPKNNRLLISWPKSPSTVILEPKKRKSVTTSTFSLSICHTVMVQVPWS